MVESSASPPGSRVRDLWMVLVFVLVIYAPSLGNGFAMDGAMLATGTTDQGTPRFPAKGPGHYFGTHYWATTGAYDGLYRPATIYSFALAYHAISQPFLAPEWEALPHHAINVVLHLLAVVLVWIWVRDLGADPPIARLVALIFGVHAIHSEVVSGIVGRSELFAFVFGLAAMCLIGRGRLALVAASVCAFLAFCSKESALVLLAFLPCFEIARGWLRKPRPWFRSYLAIVVPAVVVWFLLRQSALQSTAGLERIIPNLNNPLEFVDYGTRALTGIKIWGYGLLKCTVPYPLSSLYGLGTFSIVDTPFDPGFLASAMVIGGLGFVGLRYARRQPIVFLSIALLLGFSFPTSNLTVVTGTIFGERHYYTPSLGLCLLAGWAVAQTTPSWKRSVLIVLALYCAGNAAVVLHRNRLWKDSETLALHDVTVQPRSADLHEKAADACWFAEPPDTAAALAHLDAALEIYPEFPGALIKRGTYHAQRGEHDKALGFYEKALESRFNRMPADRSQALHAIGTIHFEKGRVNLGLTKTLEALRVDPSDPQRWAQLIQRVVPDKRISDTKVHELLSEAERQFPRILRDFVARNRALRRSP